MSVAFKQCLCAATTRSLTMRVGRAIVGSANLAADLVRAGCSILLLGGHAPLYHVAVRCRLQTSSIAQLALILDIMNMCRTARSWEE